MTHCAFCGIKIPANPTHIYETSQPDSRFLLCDSCAEIIEQVLEAQMKRVKQVENSDD